jgi:NADH-quinone oxidoreductase subunit C
MSEPEADEETAAPEAAAAPEPPSLYGVPSSESCGQVCLHPAREDLYRFVMTLRDEHAFTVCIDVTAVDYLVYEGGRALPDGIQPERFELVVMLLSQRDRQRVRLRVQVPGGDPVVPSLFDVHPGTEAMEREVYDMFGIRFDGHPDLSRILMPEDWIGHPLRKDYAIGRIPVQFKGVESAR